MSHYRGQITTHRDMIYDDYYFRVYRGCEWLDDFYNCDDYETALKVQAELLSKNYANK